MASTYSTNLALELIGTGDQSGTWGNTTNTNLGTLIEQAISGYVTQAITDGADTTITIPNGATGVARNMAIEMTGALTAARNLIVPANKKLYFIYNNTTGGFAVTVKVSGQTGVSVPNGKKMLLVVNGTDVVEAVNAHSTLAVAGAATFGSTTSHTGVASFADGTVGTPGLNFSSDTDSGIYRIGANNIGIGVNGAKVLDIATTGVGITGAVTATSINFGGSTLSTYTESSYTGTVTGFSTAITKTIYYTKVGNLVVVETQEIGATSNATTKTITGAPAAIQCTTANKRFVGNVSDNGGTYVAGMIIFNGGTFTIYPNLTGGNWTASGTAVIEDFHISFTTA